MRPDTGVQDSGGFVLLTGEVGTGKTTVCRCLLQQLPDNTRLAFVLNPKLNSVELLATICDELDIVYPDLSDKEQARVRAQIAFLGYLVNSPAYWSTKHDFYAMFINMHTTVHKTQASISAMLNDHPMAEEWMANAMGFLEENLLNPWADENGDWIGTHVEAPR